MKCTQSVSEMSHKTNILPFDIRQVRSPFKFDITLPHRIFEMWMEQNVTQGSFLRHIVAVEMLGSLKLK